MEMNNNADQVNSGGGSKRGCADDANILASVWFLSFMALVSTVIVPRNNGAGY